MRSIPVARLSRIRAVACALISIVAFALGACGDSGSEPNPGGNNNGVPASIAIQIGNGQEAAALTDVAVPPAVIVKDAGGTPVPSVQVTFTVIEGGGSVAGGTATTNSNGIAAVRIWKMGGQEGTNRLRATVAGLPEVIFTATSRTAAVEVADQTVPPSGGSFSVSRPGNLLHGLTVTIASGSFAAPTKWEIYAVSKDTIPGKANIGFDFSFEIVTDADDAVNPVEIVLPVPPSPVSGAYAMFAYIAGTNIMVPIPSITHDGRITMAVRNFSPEALSSWLSVPQAASPDEVAGIGSLGGIRVGGIKIPDEFGEAVITQAPEIFPPPKAELTRSKLVNAVKVTPFKPGVDDWEFPNAGTVPNSFGMCGGMVATSIWYFNNVKATRGALFGRDDLANPIWEDNRRGIRWSSLTQQSFKDGGGALENLMGQMTQKWDMVMSFGTDAHMFAEIAASIEMTGRPEMLGVFDASGAGHAVVVYGVSGQSLLVADPNYPGESRTIALVGGNLAPYNGKIDGTSPITYTKYRRLSMMLVRSTVAAQQAWLFYLANTVGNTLFPADRIDWKDGETWRAISGNKQIVWKDNIQLRVICPNCPNKRGNSTAATNQQFLIVYDGDGTNKREEGANAAEGVTVPLSIGTKRFGLHTSSYDEDPANGALFRTWLDYQVLDVVRSRLSITPVNSTQSLGLQVTFTAVIEGEGPASPRYVWTYGDGQSENTTTPTGRVTYNQTGTYVVKVVLFDDATGRELTSAQTNVTIVAPIPVWRFTTFVLTSQQNPPGPDHFNPAWDEDANYFTRIVNTPQSGLFIYHPGGVIPGNNHPPSVWIQWVPDLNTITLQHDLLPRSVGYTPPNPGWNGMFKWGDAGDSFSGDGNVFAGTYGGRWTKWTQCVSNCGPGPNRDVYAAYTGSATKSGVNLTGSFVVRYYYQAFGETAPTASWTRTYNFTAVRVR